MLSSNILTNTAEAEALDILNLVLVSDVNDYYISAGHKPYIRRQGIFEEVDAPVITQDHLENILKFLLKNKEDALQEARQQLTEMRSFHFSGTLSRELDGISRECRFRAILVRTINGPQLNVRVLDRNLMRLEALGLLEDHYQRLLSVLRRNKGLILIIGPTGAGKSTTLAAMIQHLVEHFNYHIITLEDPVEFIYQRAPHAYSLVTQRCIGVDCVSYQQGLMDALRMKPDVIALGEIRDPETMNTIITAAETGHLVLGTLHASTVSQALERLMMAGHNQTHRMYRQMLANNLLCVLAQNLLPCKREHLKYPKRVICYELIANSENLSKWLLEDNPKKTEQLQHIIETDGVSWHQTLERLASMDVIDADWLTRY